MKTKKKVAKPVQLKAAKAKSASMSKVSKKPLRRPVSQPQVSKQAPVKVSKSAVTAVKVSVAERLSTSRLVKSAAEVRLKAQKAELKLLAKGSAKGAAGKGKVVGVKIPATKITRSEPPVFGAKVITGNFSIEASPAKAVLATRPASSEKVTAIPSVVSSVSFKAGDKIVYPGHGVGEIEGIRTTVLGGQEHHIYNIKIIDTGMKVMVPVSQASSVGLRKIVDKRAIEEVYAILRDRDFKIDTQTWNRRFREYSQKIKTGSVFEIAMVLRDLSVLSADKELSFGEKKMLDMAEALLVSEIAIAKARPHDKVAGELRALFT